jgi:hypothetical protein
MDEINKSIKDLWVTGLTASQISKELKISRGSILGRIYRMRESKEIGVRDCDVRMNSIRTKTAKLEKERVLTLFDVMRETSLEKEDIIELIKQPVPPQEPTTKPIKFDKLTYRSCRYVLNDGDPANFLFCGKEKNGRAYCKEHEALCYHHIEKRGKK